MASYYSRSTFTLVPPDTKMKLRVLSIPSYCQNRSNPKTTLRRDIICQGRTHGLHLTDIKHAYVVSEGKITLQSASRVSLDAGTTFWGLGHDSIIQVLPLLHGSTSKLQDTNLSLPRWRILDAFIQDLNKVLLPTSFTSNSRPAIMK